MRGPRTSPAHCRELGNDIELLQEANIMQHCSDFIDHGVLIDEVLTVSQTTWWLCIAQRPRN
jgi:hypothetical protein